MLQCRFYSLLLLMLLFFTACGPDYLFQEQKTLPNQEWTYENVNEFTIEVPDTLQLYNLYLDIEHSVDYPRQNIYILIHTQFPSGEKLSKRIPIDFANKGGQWYGDCGSEWCTLQVTIQEGAFFNAIGTHVFGFEQYMRINPLPGIKSLAFKIEKTEQTR